MLGALTGTGAGTLGLLLFIYGTAGAMGNAVVGRITDRHGSGVGIAGTLLMLTAGLVFLPLAGQSLVATAALLILWGLGGWGIMPAVQHRLIALSPANAGVVIAFNSSALYLGMGLGGIAGGAVAARLGWSGLGPAVAVVALLALGVFWCAARTASPATGAAAPAGTAGPAADKAVSGQDRVATVREP